MGRSRSPRSRRRRSDSSDSSGSGYRRRRRRDRSRTRRRDSRSHSRERDRRRSRSDSRSPYRGDRGRSDRNERWKTRVGEPTKSVMLRGLPQTLSEAELAANVASYRPVGVRLITDRGFGFVEFSTIPEAEHFVKENLDTLSIQGRYVHIDFSHGAKRDDGRAGGTGTRLDWLCGHCGAHNFARRAVCFQCSMPKDNLATALRDSYYQPDGKEGDPNPVLVILGLGSDTTEESIRYTFQPFAPIVDVRVMRDKTAGGGSRGFAFVQFNNTDDATLALNRSKGIMIDGRSVRVSFSRDQGKAAKAAWQDPKMWERPANLSEVGCGLFKHRGIDFSFPVF